MTQEYVLTRTQQICAGMVLTAAMSRAVAEPTEISRTVPCNTPDVVFGQLLRDYGEKPQWVGQSGEDVFVVLVTNPVKKTWSMVEYNKTLACVLSVGVSRPTQSAESKKK
jgi:hypothetical protein